MPPNEAARANAELRREISHDHVLFGRSFTAIGYRQDCDDVLFYLGETAPRFAVVHLTQTQETNSQWPRTRFFDSLTEWIENGLDPDASEFEE